VERDSAEKTAFEMNIAGLGDEVVGLRLQLGEVTRRAELAQVATADRDQQIGGLVQNVASLEQARDRLARDNVTLVGREGALQAELLSLEQMQQALLAVRGELETEVTRLDKEKSGVEKERRVLSKTLTTVTRERDVLLEDKAQLVKKQSALRIEKESMVARLAEQGALLASRQKQLVTLSGAHQVLGEEKAAATVALRSRTSERDILSLEKSRLLEEGTTNALRLEVLAEEKREIARQLAETAFQRQTFKGQVTSLEHSAKELEARNKQLSEEGSQLKEAAGHLITQRKQLQTDLRGRNTELTELAGDKRSLETRIQQLNAVQDGLTASLKAMTDDRDRLLRTERTLQREKDHLLARLTETRQQQEGGAAEIVRLRRQVVELDKKEQALVGEREAAQNAIERLEKKRSRLLQQTAALRAENAHLASDYLEAQRIQRQMREDIAGYSKKLDVAEGGQRMSVQALAALKARYAKEITALQAEQRALVDELKGQHSALQVKYDRLVRPARTFLGKYVVRIGYWKEGGIFRYSLREPRETQARNVNEQQLHRSLTALKSVYGKRLYTKILFPREAELSQKDAWRFTHQILRQYDYYSQ
jgi:chromosome segregation ATPase